MEAKNGIGERLKAARKSRRMTQAQACEAAGLTRVQSLSAYERGLREPPIAPLAALAKAYNTSLDWLVFGAEADQAPVERSEMDLIFDLIRTAEALGMELTRIPDTGDETAEPVFRPTDRTSFQARAALKDLSSVQRLRAILEPAVYEVVARQLVEARFGLSPDV